MARSLRIEGAGLSYHVWARGAGRMAIYTDDRDRERFLELLGEALVSHGVDCHAFCLMTNHYHAVITTSEANLSHTIHQVNSRYAQWWSQRHARPGHVFQGRFGAQIVQNEAYLLTVCVYAVNNPVRARLVVRPEDWRWSSYRATAGLEVVPPFLHPDVLWQLLGGDRAEAAWARYREFVLTAGQRNAAPPRDLVLGDESFVQRFKERRHSAGSEVPRRVRITRPPLSEFFAEAYTREDRASKASAAHAAGYSLREIATVLAVHYTTVSRMVSGSGRCDLQY